MPPVLLTEDEFRDGTDEPGVLGVGFDVRSIRGGSSGIADFKININKSLNIFILINSLGPKVLVRVPYNCCSSVGLLNPYLLSTVNLLV